MKTSQVDRVFYFDHLRVMLTILVIAHHVGQAYGPTGGSWPVQETARAAVLGPFFTVNRSFFMSLFFLISGYFMVSALERHPPGKFIRGRLVRLGIPILAWVALTLPIRVFLFGEKIARWDGWFSVGHLWYLEHVLLFSILYAMWRLMRQRSAGAQPARRGPPGFLPTVACLLVVAVACGVVRIWSPIDRWFNLLGFFSVAFADVPRDLACFIIGASACRNGWVQAYPSRRGFAWLAAGLAAAGALYVVDLTMGARSVLGTLAFAIAYPLWEGVVCFGMCIGLLVLFRELLNRQRSFGRLLAANQYSAYFWHPLLIVPLQAAALSLSLEPFIKFILVTVVGVPLVFAWSWMFRLIRGVRAVL